MKDRPRQTSSYGSLYVPPHHRLRSAVTSSASPPRQPPRTVSSADGTSKITSPCPYLPRQQQQKQRKEKNSSEYEFVFDFSEEGGGRDIELPDRSVPEESVNPSGIVFQHEFQCASTSDNINAWKRKLTALLHRKDQEELLSREKKDRRDYEQIAVLANRMGLYSQLYAKVILVSKVPLPNYRFDLDDRRPQREVSLPPGLERRVDNYLGEYLSQKARSMRASRDNVISRSSSNGSMATDEGLFEQPEPFPHSKAAMEKIIWRRSLQMRSEQQAWQDSPEGWKMLEFRRGLPAFKEKDAILAAISENQVVIISGETGCGKTTQIPQFILESEIESVHGATCSIICTQPRRISAMSVSERVASERGEKLGEMVGYKVRLEGMKGRDTHLLFCTTGILLRRLLVDRSLKGVTHLVNGWQRMLIIELFRISAIGFTYPVQTHFLENILELTGYRLTAYNQIDDYGLDKTWKMNKQAPRKRKSQIVSAVEDALKAADFNEFSPQTRESLSCWNPDCIGFNLIEQLLCHICERERPGAVLVFMTGWDDISSLKEKLQAHPILGDTGRVLLLACHGSMASSEQDGVRKIVLATNIAETSITIDDVVFVIDCGKAKETSYDALNNTPCLLPSWISKVSARQRRGRAGRVQPGECYHLYPRCVYDAFADFQLPEILRTPLQSLCLQIKSLKLGSISEFLSRALQSPELLAVQNAVDYLKIIGALDEDENLTVLVSFTRSEPLTGRYLTMLPMEPKLGKMLILGAILNCLDPVLTVVAGLSVRDPFLTPFDKKDLAEAAKSQFSREYSDHLALVRAYEGWQDAEKDLAGYEYCWKNFLSAQSMKAIDSLRREFYSLLKDTGLVDSNRTTCNTWSYDEHLLRAVICYGLYPGICSVVQNEKSFSLKTMEDGQNSVNARNSTISYPWLVFNEKIKVNSVFIRDSTAISDSVLLLFGGSLLRGEIEGHVKMLGGYLEFFMKPSIAALYQSLRRELEDLIQIKLLNPGMDIHCYHELLSALRWLISEDRCDGRFVFNRQVLRSSKPSVTAATHSSKSFVSTAPMALGSRIDSGPGGDNSKSQLQTLLTRAGYAAPTYKTQQLKNNQFQATVEFNGVQILGQPCNNKKQAEKDAAAEALEWLIGGRQTGRDYIENMSMMLKKSKREHNQT
ncbi:hypothetical protein RJ639_030552 [Escallonia herrerae]|uniref:RNA helicase n=1 Tax=Escallonia herrerae TaxID=1293975 RepID=A0AA88X4J2_9ASTE|nr:hypothetical protein RJ639_030552 [Escallonia herrerae]